MDFVSLSYCNSAPDLYSCRALLDSIGMQQTKIIAKAGVGRTCFQPVGTGHLHRQCLLFRACGTRLGAHQHVPLLSATLLFCRLSAKQPCATLRLLRMWQVRGC